MTSVTKEQIEYARSMDLLTYLQNFEPHELVRFSADVYTTRTHDSLKIKRDKWYWWSRKTGGRSALDYLITVNGMKFTEAVEQLCGKKGDITFVPIQAIPPTEKKEFELPKPYFNNNRVKRYLTARGIDQYLIDYLIKNKLLYEDIRHNCVFVGHDNGVAKYASLRGSSSNSVFVGDVAGSNKNYSFALEFSKGSEKLYVFECVIDLLSFVSIGNMGGVEHTNSFLSLSGVYDPAKDNTDLPMALEHYLSKHPNIKEIVLCLDNDEIGIAAAKAIMQRLPEKYQVTNSPPKGVKDYNKLLMKIKGIKTKIKTRGEDNSSPSHLNQREAVR